MLCLEITVRTRPPLTLPATDRSWWISWTYGPEQGHLAGATCACEVLCGGSVRGEVLEAALQAAVRAGAARVHQLELPERVEVKVVTVVGAPYPARDHAAGAPISR